MLKSCIFTVFDEGMYPMITHTHTHIVLWVSSEVSLCVITESLTIIRHTVVRYHCNWLWRDRQTLISLNSFNSSLSVGHLFTFQWSPSECRLLWQLQCNIRQRQRHYKSMSDGFYCVLFLWTYLCLKVRRVSILCHIL